MARELLRRKGRPWATTGWRPLVAIVACLLAACGGDASAPQAPQTQAERAVQSADSRKRTLTAVVHAPTAQVDAFVLLSEARRAYPSLFGAALVTQRFGRYVYRFDAGTGNYVAYTDSDIVLMGPVVNSATTPVVYDSLANFCAQPATAGFCGFKYQRTVTIDGSVREYIVYVPWRSRNAAQLPVVFMLHGTSGNGDEFYEGSGWRELADREGFIAVFPTALRHCLLEDDVTVNGIFENNEIRAPTKWASGVLGDPSKMPLCSEPQRLLLQAPAAAATNHPIANDLAFFDHMVGDLTANFSADARRIYGSGFSNGGQMAARLAAERSTVFAALASAAGDAYEGLPLAVRPMSFVYSVGELDDRYTAATGMPSLPLTDQGAVPGFADPVVRSIARPLQLDHTRYTFASSRLYGTTIATHTYTSSTAAPAGGNMLHVSIIAGATHQYPDGRRHPVKMAEVLWAFFAPLSLP
jgi:polyhydroxybutyrate depolymerase